MRNFGRAPGAPPVEVAQLHQPTAVDAATELLDIYGQMGYDVRVVRLETTPRIVSPTFAKKCFIRTCENLGGKLGNKRRVGTTEVSSVQIVHELHGNRTQANEIPGEVKLVKLGKQITLCFKKFGNKGEVCLREKGHSGPCSAPDLGR